MARLTGNGDKWLRDDAAAAFNRMVAERGPIKVNSAARSVAEQNALIARWRKGGAANRPPNLYEPANPPERSNHVANGGIAFDTSDISRVRGFASQYGFKWYGSSDPVHFTFVGGGSSSVGTASQEVKNQQAWLNASQNAGLSVDGILGPKTRAAIRAYQRVLGVGADGIWGGATQAAHQRYYDARQGGGSIAVDGKWGGSTTRLLQARLGVTQDGKFGSQTIKALQGKLGVAQDGQFGPASKKALQRRLGVAQDGIFGVQSIRALQAFINTQGF